MEDDKKVNSKPEKEKTEAEKYVEGSKKDIPTPKKEGEVINPNEKAEFLKEEVKGEEKPKGKGFSLTPEIIKKQRRLHATGFKVNNGDIQFIIPPDIKKLKDKQKVAKMKKMKVAKKSKKINRGK